MANKKNKKSKKKIIIIVILVVLIGILIFSNKTSKNTETKIKFENIEKRDIAQSISATGIVTTSNTKNVVSVLTGSKITAVNVKEGDKINVGDVICSFDTSDISNNLAALQATAKVAKEQGNLGVQSAQRNLNDGINSRDTQVSITQNDVNNALKAYEDAVNQLNSARTNLTNSQNALKAYQATYNTNSANYGNIKKQYEEKETAYNNANNEYNAKLAELANAENEYKKYFNGSNQLDPVSGAIIDSANYQAGSYATVAHQTVEATYNKTKSEAQALETKLNTAKSDYLNYKGTYDSSTSSINPMSEQYKSLVANVTNLQATVKTLEETANKLKLAYEGNVQAYNAAVTGGNSSVAGLQDALKNSMLSSSISTTNQEVQIKSLQKQLEEGNLKSTVSGTVTAVNVKKGDIYTGTVIAVIEGTEQFIVESEIDEYDIPDVKEGMEVLIKTDATRDEELKGKVIYTAASSSQNSSSITSMAGATSAATGVSLAGGDATYKIQIELETPNDRLRLGMNAKLSIIVDSKQDVWTVPFETIYEREDGSKYIEILKNEETQEKEELDVETGIEGTYYIEIKSDKLTEGMKVVLPEVNTNDSIETLIKAMGADAGV